MNSHELANLLLSIPARPVTASVDISTCDEDAHHRVFGNLAGVNDLSDPGEVVLLFENGESNDT